jgi:hypothetical protein
VLEAVLNKLAEHGVVGLFAAAFLWLFIQKDKELAKETAARIADAKDMLKIALDLQSRTNDSVGKLSDILDELRRRGGRGE